MPGEGRSTNCPARRRIVDDWDKSASIDGGAPARRSISLLERMKYNISSLTNEHVAEASAVIQESFLALAAADWRPDARRAFIDTTAPACLQKLLAKMTIAAGAFSEDGITGVILMPSPNLLGILFVRPSCLRLGIGRSLWESARAQIEARFPEVHTVELNATPYAVPFYKSVGFAPISSEFERDGQRAIRMACWLPARALDASVS